MKKEPFWDKWQRLKEYEGNYPEDYTHENGNYMNICRVCGSYFIGHKRRVWCKLHLIQTKNQRNET